MSAPVRAVLEGSDGVPGLQRLIDGRRTRRDVHGVLRGLAPSLPAGAMLRLRRVTWKPGRTARASFDLATAGSVVPVHLRWFLDRSESPPSDAAPAPRPRPVRADVAPTHAAAALFRSGDAAVAAGRLLVWPVDPDRPHVAELVGRRLAPLAGTVGRAASPHVRVVRYRPGQRHVLHVTGAASSVFVKIGQPADVPAALVRADVVRAALAAHSVHVGAPVWASTEWGAVAFGARAGHSLAELVGNQRAGAAEALRATGAVLAALHRATPVDISGLGRIDATVEAAAVRRAGEHLSLLAPDTVGPLCALLDHAVAVLEHDATADVALVHGDAKCDHVLVHRGGLGLIDFDSVAMGDPAFDVGRLLADLVWLVAPAWRPAARAAFMLGYQRRDRRFLRRVAAWEALAIVKQAVRRIPVLDPHIGPRFAGQLVEARLVLAPLARSIGPLSARCRGADRRPAGS